MYTNEYDIDNMTNLYKDNWTNHNKAHMRQIHIMIRLLRNIDTYY